MGRSIDGNRSGLIPSNYITLESKDEQPDSSISKYVPPAPRINLESEEDPASQGRNTSTTDPDLDSDADIFAQSKSTTESQGHVSSQSNLPIKKGMRIAVAKGPYTRGDETQMSFEKGESVRFFFYSILIVAVTCVKLGRRPPHHFDFSFSLLTYSALWMIWI